MDAKEAAERAGTGPLVVHVLPIDMARGAQRYARALVDAFESRSSQAQSHLILTLFAGDRSVLEADVALDVPRGPLRRSGIDPRAVLRLRKEMRRLRPAVVVAHGGESAKYAALALPKSIPIVYLRIGTAHASLQRRPFSRWLHSRYLNRAALVASVSADVAEEVTEDFGVAPDRVLVIPNARHADQYQPSGHDPERAAVRLVFVGHLDEGKRPDWFVEVVRELRARGSEVEPVIVGSGPLEEMLRPSADELGIQMLGRRDDVPSLLAAGDVFVFTSLPPGEGMPGVLIEAGLAGLPTVATRVPGARDVVLDGVTGFLVDIEDRAGMVEALQRLVADPALRERMGRAARDHCLQRFTFEVTMTQWDAVFHQLADPAPPEQTSPRREAG